MDSLDLPKGLCFVELKVTYTLGVESKDEMMLEIK